MAPLNTGFIRAVLAEVAQIQSGRGRGTRSGAATIAYAGASGGVISDYLDPTPGIRYRAHIFTSSGTFTVTDSALTSVQYLVVAGGGGGGGHNSGGGAGAGGFRTNVPGHPLAGSPFPISPGPYTVTVGAGGRGSVGAGPQGTNGTP